MTLHANAAHCHVILKETQTHNEALARLSRTIACTCAEASSCATPDAHQGRDPRRVLKLSNLRNSDRAMTPLRSTRNQGRKSNHFVGLVFYDVWVVGKPSTLSGAPNEPLAVISHWGFSHLSAKAALVAAGASP